MAATVLTYVEPGVIERKGVGANLLDREFDMLLNRRNAVPLEGAGLFQVVRAAKDVFKAGTVGNELELPRENEDTDALPYVTPPPGFTKTINVVNYRSAIAVTRTMVEDDQHGKVKGLMSGLIDSARYHMEYGFADMFNNGFATYEWADGMYLFDTVHPNEARETGTWDNTTTAAALTHSAYSSARTRLRKRTNARGYYSGMKPMELITVPDKEEAAKIIMASEKVSGNALNDKNVFQGDATVKIWGYLTSTTAWFIAAKVEPEQRGLLYVQRVAPNVAPVKTVDPDILFDQRLRMRYAIGATSCRELDGNSGA